MSGYFSKYVPCCQQCNVARQIVGSKLWIGFAQQFNFPGFVDDFSGWWGLPPGHGAWANGGNFAVGDLATRSAPSVSGGGFTYPAYSYVYRCIAAVAGSAADPATDSTHFAPWDFNVTGAASPGGPSGWPPALNLGRRQVWTSSTDTAYFELTVTTAFANCPSIGPGGYPTSVDGTPFTAPWNDVGQPSFTKAYEHVDSANSPFAYDWTFANKYDGTVATYTPPSNAPDIYQTACVFPAIPLTPLMYNGGDSMNQLQTHGLDLPRLVSLTASATSISFEFGIWINDTIGPSFLPVYGAPATVTQTLTLGGSSYTLSQVASDAATLRDSTVAGAATFSSIAWGTSWTNTWDTHGNVVSTRNFGFSVENSITCACRIGTEIPWAAAVNGLFTSPGTTSCYCGKAQVSVCGNYCTRTYNCPTVTCVSGSAGSTPTTVEIDTPATPGESTGIYANCSCT
jgi:hypothetical protein